MSKRNSIPNTRRSGIINPSPRQIRICRRAADGKISLPIWNDELYFEYHRGVFTTQANHKRNMRESEE